MAGWMFVRGGLFPQISPHQDPTMQGHLKRCCVYLPEYYLCPYRHNTFKGVQGAQRFHERNRASIARSPPCGVHPWSRAKIMAKDRPSNCANHISNVSMLFRGPRYVYAIPLSIRIQNYLQWNWQVILVSYIGPVFIQSIVYSHCSQVTQNWREW